MVVELEVIEQIYDDDDGWALGRVRDLITRQGREDDLVVLEGMWRGGHIAFFGGDGIQCPDWRVRALFRSHGEAPECFVRATDIGLEWAFPR